MDQKRLDERRVNNWFSTLCTHMRSFSDRICLLLKIPSTHPYPRTTQATEQRESILWQICKTGEGGGMFENYAAPLLPCESDIAQSVHVCRASQEEVRYCQKICQPTMPRPFPIPWPSNNFPEIPYLVAQSRTTGPVQLQREGCMLHVTSWDARRNREGGENSTGPLVYRWMFSSANEARNLVRVVVGTVSRTTSRLAPGIRHSHFGASLGNDTLRMS